MRAPKAVRENELVMPQNLKDEAIKITREYVWNETITDEECNEKVYDFNRRWLAAGGIKGNCIAPRGYSETNQRIV